MATIAIGDVHGALAALDELLGIVEPELEPDDELVFLGDYIDDGPDTAGCVSRIVELRARAPCPVVTLKGNHEQWMLRSHDDPTRHAWLLGMDGLSTITSYDPETAEAIRREMTEAGAALYHDAVALSYDRFFSGMPASHLEFFLGLSPFHRAADVLCVHGGYADLGMPIEQYPEDVLIWGPPGFPDAYRDGTAVVYGHRNNAVLDGEGWPRPRVTGGWAHGIDTIRHGVLTAMRFPDGRVFQSRRFDVPRRR